MKLKETPAPANGADLVVKMIERFHFFHHTAMTLLLAAFVTRTDAAPDAKPVRDTVKHAKSYVWYAPAPRLSPEIRAGHLSGKGVFALRLRADGTVSSVQTLESTGHEELDAASITAFSKWRFPPGQSKIVKIPITYTGRYGK